MMICELSYIQSCAATMCGAPELLFPQASAKANPITDRHTHKYIYDLRVLHAKWPGRRKDELNEATEFDRAHTTYV